MAAMFPTPAADANVIRYRVLFRAAASASSRTSNGCASDADDAAFVEQRRAAYSAFIQRHAADFIWHKHAMHLSVTRSSSAIDSPLVRSYCLSGEMSVGDAIDDEWVVTWLLFQLTTAFPEDDALVQVSDTDGEFLLIECADVLPDWVSPENAVNRVFVHRGMLHLVPVTIVAEFETAPPREELQVAVASKRRSRKATQRLANEQHVLTQSIQAVWETSAATRANAAMQQLIQRKISEAPHYMRTNRHRARCLLPSRAAYVLRRRPEILAAAVEAFYYRAPQEAAAVCRRMSAFPPTSCVTRVVMMTRCQYAQLKQQQFFAPLPFRHLPGVDGIASGDNSPATRAAEIGVKLACGLELLYTSSDCDQFGVQWSSIVDDASAGFASEEEEARVQDDTALEDDDDAWLYVHPDTLDEKLQRVASRTAATVDDGSEAGDVGGAEELQNIATMFNNFISGVSGVDGVADSEPVSLDMSSFMEILNGQLKASSRGASGVFEIPEIHEEEDEWNDPDDGDDDDDDSSIDSDDEVEDRDDQQPEDEEDRIMREAMEEMDAELRGTTLSKTFSRPSELGHDASPLPTPHDSDEKTVEAEDADKPLDLDFHLLSNLLESMASQEGLAGPVSNILSEITGTTR